MMVAMATVELFYSYAHRDAALCEKLRSHLAGMKRSGLIRDWYDHMIEPGSEWSVEIEQAMERAGIILLLVSADFVASDYINKVEVPFALKRRQSGHARVIPVLLRAYDWHDLPYASLQWLPSGVLAVTSWDNEDEAFSDIAGRLRELVYNDRSREVAAAEPPIVTTRVTQERVLDAAIASSVVIDEPTDFVTMVRTTESSGLKAILQIDRTYSPTSEDVQSKTFELDFPSGSSGEILPATLELALESPGFDPATQRKKIRVPPKGDSDVTVFMLTPKRAGQLRLNLQVLSANVEIASRLLVTTSVSATNAPPSLSYGVASLPIKSPIERPKTVSIAQRELEEVAFPSKQATVPGPPRGESVTRKARNPVPLLIGTVLTMILAALLVPTLTSSLKKAQLTGTMNNSRQLYLAQFAMANDGAATGDATSTWPGDLNPLPPTLLAYLNVLCEKGYLKGNDAIKLMNAPGSSFTATVTSKGGIDQLSNPSGIAALKIWMNRDIDPATTVFCTSKNYVYDTALAANGIPYGTKGFITMRKGGDASVYRAAQATHAGWTDGTKFQNAVGFKVGDDVGKPTAGDPTFPGVGVLQFP
jgi:hypothetical protein